MDTIQNMRKYSINELRKLLPDFIDDEFPKEKKTGERGAATVACVLFTCWLVQQEVKKENGKPNPKT